MLGLLMQVWAARAIVGTVFSVFQQTVFLKSVYVSCLKKCGSNKYTGLPITEVNDANYYPSSNSRSFHF